MSVKELERAVLCLTPKELTRFRQWFADYDMVQWDKQIEEDSLSGRLDHLIENAMERATVLDTQRTSSHKSIW